MSVRETPFCVVEEPVSTQKGVMSVNVPLDTRSAQMDLPVKVGHTSYGTHTDHIQI